MKQTPMHRLEQLEQQKARAGCGIVSQSKFSPGSWTAFLGADAGIFPRWKKPPTI